jgi:dCMP deaminase
VSAPTTKELRWLAWCADGAARFSTCSRRQYMALVLGPNGRIVGTGYNGSPPGLPHCVDGGCPRATSNAAHGSPYGDCLAVHAEANALLWSDRTDREGGVLFVNGPPCWDCAKLIAGSGIRRVVHSPDSAYEAYPKVLDLLSAAGVEVACEHHSLDGREAHEAPEGIA